MNTLDVEIDTLARRIERQILDNEARLADLPDFDGEWRRSRSVPVFDTDSLFL